MEIFVVLMSSSPKADVAGLTKRVRGKGQARRRILAKDRARNWVMLMFYTVGDLFRQRD
jgi:hypothetical protein